MPKDGFALKIQEQYSFREYRVIDILKKCESPYIAEHYFYEEFEIAKNSIPPEKKDDFINMLKSFRSYENPVAHQLRIIAIGMEILGGTNLRNSEIKDTQKILKFTIQIAAGLKWLHAKGIMHRDIKLDNIMVNDLNNTVISINLLILKKSLGQNN